MSPSTGHPGRASRQSGLRLLAGLAVLALGAGTLTACGSSEAGADNRITLAMHNPDTKAQDPATYALVQAFNAGTSTMKIDIVGRPVEQHQQKMTIAAQSDTLPEIFWVYDSLAKTMVKSEDLLDLTPVLAEKGLEEKFAPSMLEGFRRNGVQYGVPYQALVTGFYYNEALLRKHGVSVPRTFEDLLGAVKKLEAAGVVPIAKGSNNSSFSVWAFLTMLDRFGFEKKQQALLDGKLGYDNPDFLRLYRHLDELADAGAFPSNMSTQTYTQAVASFTSGKAAFLDSGVWEAAKIQKSAVGDDTGFWAGPTFADGVGDQKLAMNAPSAPLVVSAAVKKDKKKYAAVTAFLQFYYSDEGQQIMADNAQPPVTTYEPDVDPAEDEVFSTVLQEASRPGWSSPEAQPDLVVPPETANAMYDSLYGVMSGSLTPEKAVQLVQRSLS
ncbi:ABC transporter substrate-binding protein [Streptomyces sp. JJ36]|uniref:ABC transporter substrate-binding protein n=1 Tax=Streptomyces sp. JJ36 TaxID=2736645 RepID=UPI001F24FAD2|nr:extracellular solute-binding protein [Streptomyces sp. JJ36]MCF6525406.1 extracellular solute-binding protein [Streptomyces sp. JJ36]